MTRTASAARLTRLARRGLLPLKRAWLQRRVGRLVTEHVDGTPLVVLPDVFNPAVFRTSVQLVKAVDAHVSARERVLDLGTGSGVAAVRAAMRGARVTATDVNPEAVRCARINALLNHVDERVDVREGDLYEPVRGERFDWVLCNPPFFRGRPRNPRDVSWRSEAFLERFAQGLDSVLAAEGRALVVFSSDGDEHGLLAACAAEGLDATIERTKDMGNEVITVYLLTRRSVAR